MLGIVNSCCCLGMETHQVRVEVDVSPGLPAFGIVGLPDPAVRESTERVRSAIRNAGLEFPMKRITVNLAPADLRKEGSLFDLPIAAGILAATGQIPQESLTEIILMGELSLDGNISPVSGVLLMGADLYQKDPDITLILPYRNLGEASLVRGLQVYGGKHLSEVVAHLRGEGKLGAAEPFSSGQLPPDERSQLDNLPDFSDVVGQEKVKRALEIAAAGGHNLLLVGPPGSGKTLLARRLNSILPPLGWEESLEVTKIYSVAGRLPPDQPLITSRPFRSPHHTASAVSIIGGGRFPKPGEVSFASYGVLFLDELPEFGRDVLEALRQPLEEGTVTVTRTAGSCSYPARFIFVGAMNPCPCGYYGDRKINCHCTPHQVQRYRNKISGPILDRIDLQVNVPRIEIEELAGHQPGEKSERIRERVINAFQIQQKRFQEQGITFNARMGHRQIKKYCILAPGGEELLYQIFHKMNLSMRSLDRVVKVARTIADLDGSGHIKPLHLAEAIQYRSFDRVVTT